MRRITQTPQEHLRPGQKSDWLPQPETYRWIFVDFQDSRMASQERLLSYLLEAMELPVPSPCNLDWFMNEVSSNLNSPTVILMDEIGVGLQRCPELDDAFWESLRALATNQAGGNLAFVLATPESPVDLAHQRGELGFSVPIGYVRRPSGEICFDPDEQAQQVVKLIFRKFEELGTF